MIDTVLRFRIYADAFEAVASRVVRVGCLPSKAQMVVVTTGEHCRFRVDDLHWELDGSEMRPVVTLAPMQFADIQDPAALEGLRAEGWTITVEQVE